MARHTRLFAYLSRLETSWGVSTEQIPLREDEDGTRSLAVERVLVSECQNTTHPVLYMLNHGLRCTASTTGNIGLGTEPLQDLVRVFEIYQIGKVRSSQSYNGL